MNQKTSNCMKAVADLAAVAMPAAEAAVSADTTDSDCEACTL